MIGRTVGRFRVLAKLGEGGMGSVWKAEDTLLERLVALKFLPDKLVESPDARRRFLGEARASSAMSHPGVATLFEAGEHEGRLYLATALVDGETIAALVARGPLAPARALQLAAETADALAHAHSRGVVHRDVTSRNIMVNREGRAVLIDFGLAYSEGSTRLSSTGNPVGTAAYMSPEAVLGSRADARSDIYGLGVVLYEMLAGSLPFSGQRMEALLYSVVHEKAELPSARNPAVPKGLDAVVLRAMAKDPADRYQSAEQLALALRSAANAAPDTQDATAGGMPYGRGESAAPQARDSEAATKPAPQPRPPTRATNRFELPPRLAAAAFQEHMARALGYLEHADNEASVDGAIALLSDILQVEPDSSLVHATLARAYACKYKLTLESQYAYSAGSECETALGLDPHSPEALVALGLLSTLTGDHSRGIEALQKSLALRPHNPDALMWLASNYDAAQNPSEAERTYRELIAMRPDYWIGHNKLGLLYFRTGRYEDALAPWKRVTELEPRNYMGFTNLGAAYFCLGRLDEALAAYQSSLQVGPSASGYANMGIIHFIRARYPEATAMFERAVALRPADPMMWGNLGDAQRWRPGLEHSSAESFDRAIELQREQLDVNPENARGWASMANWLAKRGRTGEALRALERAFTLAPGDQYSMERAVTVHHLAGNTAEALRCLKQAASGNPELLELRHDPELSELIQSEAGRRILGR